MSDFFGKLKQTIDKSAKVITTKSASAIDTTKLKSEIANINRQKNEVFTKIGMAVYNAGEGEFNLGIVSEELQMLKSYDADILLKEQELDRIKAETEDKLQQINAAYQEPAAPGSAPAQGEAASDEVQEVSDEENPQ